MRQGELLVEGYTGCLQLLLKVMEVLDANCSHAHASGQPCTEALSMVERLQHLLSVLASLPLATATGAPASTAEPAHRHISEDKAAPRAASSSAGPTPGIAAVLQLLSVSSTTDAAVWQLEAFQRQLSAQQVQFDLSQREAAASGEVQQRLQAGRTALTQVESRKAGLLALLASLRNQGRLSEAAQLETEALPVCEKEWQAMNAAVEWLAQAVLYGEQRVAAVQQWVGVGY
jgi:hypothetical protein